MRQEAPPALLAGLGGAGRGIAFRGGLASNCQPFVAGGNWWVATRGLSINHFAEGCSSHKKKACFLNDPPSWLPCKTTGPVLCLLCDWFSCSNLCVYWEQIMKSAFCMCNVSSCLPHCPPPPPRPVTPLTADRHMRSVS